MLSNAFANDLLRLLFNGTAIAGIADNAASSPLTNLYWSLHTADPGASGNQSTNEVNYAGYARLSAARSSGGFTVSSVTMSPTANMEFPEMTGGASQTATHLCIGTANTGAAGKVLFRFQLSPSIQLNNAVVPRLRTTTTLTAITA